MTPRVQTENGSIIQVTERAESEGWWGASKEGQADVWECKTYPALLT